MDIRHHVSGPARSLPPLKGARLLRPAGRLHHACGAGGASPFRVLVSTTPGGTVIVAASEQETDRTLRRLVTIELLSGGLILLVATLSGLWLTRLGLRPLVRMEAAAENIAEENLAARLPEAAAGTEVGRLSRALNTMLTRLESAFTAQGVQDQLRQSEERLRRFAADASHELRTPIASVRLHGAVPAPWRKWGRCGIRDLKIEQESARLTRLVDDLLLLARLDDHRPSLPGPVDLGAWPTCRRGSTGHRPRPHHRTVGDRVGRSDRRPRPSAPGDRQPARERLHAHLPGRRCWSPLRPMARPPCSRSQTRTGLSDEQRKRVFERAIVPTRRQRSAVVPVSGLSIIAAIVTAHGGRATALPRDGGGTRFRVDLPAHSRTCSSRYIFGQQWGVTACTQERSLPCGR